LLKNPEGCHSEPPQAARNLHFPAFFCKMQIPRFARDDRQKHFFNKLPKPSAVR